jgi:hypothetical protein
VFRSWIGGGTLDPETYWCSHGEAVQLFDDLGITEERQQTMWPITHIEVTPFTGQHESLAGGIFSGT